MKALCTYCQAPVESIDFVYNLDETGAVRDLLNDYPVMVRLVSLLEQELGRGLFFYSLAQLWSQTEHPTPAEGSRIVALQMPITAAPILAALHQTDLWSEDPAGQLMTLSALLDLPAQGRELDRLHRQLTSSQVLGQLPVELITILDSRGSEVPVEVRHGLTGSRLSGKYCPKCFRPLSDLAGLHREVVVALAGAERIGKTAVATAAVSYLLHPNPTGLELLLPPEDDPKWSVFRDTCLRRYEQGLAVQKTHTAQTQALSVTLPLRIPQGREQWNTVNLTIVDLPGEFFSEVIQDQWFAQYGKLYQNASVIWFPTDLAQLAQMRCPDAGYGYDGKEIQVDVPILRRNLNTLRQRLDTGGTEKPFCVILNKSDMAEAESHAPWLYTPEDVTDRYLTHSMLHEQHWGQLVSKVRRYFQTVNASYLEVLEDAFPIRTFVALSAYGHPVDQNTPRINAPFNVAAPLIWSLAILSLLPVARLNADCRLEVAWMNRNGTPDDALLQNLGRPRYGPAGQPVFVLSRPPVSRRSCFLPFARRGPRSFP